MIAPQLSDPELIALAVIQALLAFTFEARFIRHAHTRQASLFPNLPQRPAYNKRLRRGGATMQHIINTVARECPPVIMVQRLLPTLKHSWLRSQRCFNRLAGSADATPD